MELNDYLLTTLRQSFAPVTFSGQSPTVVNRILVKGVDCDKKILNLEPAVNNGICLTLPDSVTGLSTEELESNWRYYISTDKTDLYYCLTPHDMFGKESDKYIYGLFGLYCNSEKDALIHIWSLNAIRVWINGRLVVTTTISYNLATILFGFKFRKGMNTILFERLSFPLSHKKLGIVERENMITITPLEFLAAKENQVFFDEDLLGELKNSYAVIPEKALIKEEEVKFTVLPMWFDNSAREKVQIEIRNAEGGLLKSFPAYTGEEIRSEIGENHKGVLVIKALGTENNKKSLGTYIFKGNFAKERTLLLQKAELLLGPKHALLETMRRLVRIPDICNETAELAQEELYVPMLKNYAEFEKALLNEADIKTKSLFDIFERTVMQFQESEIDDGFVAYRIYLPENYAKDKFYPLVLVLEWGYASSTIPRTVRYIRRGKFDEAIIITICARGELNRDFINELDYLRIIDNMLHNFNIDRERIYAIAVCTAAVKIFGLAIRKPDLFSGFANFQGMPRISDVENLNNIENMTIYNIFNFNDGFNIGMIFQDQTERVGKVKNYFYDFFTHNQFNNLFNSRGLLKALLNEKTEKYPKKIRFYIQEPVFNKSYWVFIERIEDLSRKAMIEAEIVNRDEVKISINNIKAFSLLLGEAEMNLLRRIDIQVNGDVYNIETGAYSRIKFIKEDKGHSVTVTPMEREEFQKQYDSLSVNEELLGLKEIYLKKCVILRSNSDNGENYLDPLWEILQSPLKEKLRSYKYEMRDEGTIDEAMLSQSNFVIYISPAEKSGLKEKMLKVSGLTLEQNRISYGKYQLSGDYFALIKVNNPFNEAKRAMIVTCNSTGAGEEMLKFLNSFDSNPLFYSDAVIYNNGEFHSIRQAINGHSEHDMQIVSPK